MDMHKDFIHIDDVFKRAADGEEQEGSGAWLRMKDLLDKEMPVGTTLPTRGGRFRRLLPFLLLLLLGSGAASYYSINRQNNIDNNSQPGKQTLPLANTTTAPSTTTASATNNAVPPLPQTPGSSRPEDAASALATLPNDNQTPPVRAVNSTSISENKEPVALASNGKMPTANRKMLATMAKDNIEAQPILANQAGATVIEHHKVVEQLQPKVLAGTVVAPNQPSQPDMKTTEAAIGSLPVVRSDAGTYYKEKRDTFTEISISRYLEPASRTTGSPVIGPKFVLDTLAVKRIERLRYTPLTKMEIMSLAQVFPDFPKKVAVVPIEKIYSGTTTTSEKVAMVPLADYMVSGKKMDKKSLNNLLQKTGNSLATYFDGSHNFYLGALVGGNLSVGNPMGFGMQFGLAGMYSLSERIVLAVEARVLNHNFSNYMIADTRTSYEVTSSQLPGGAWLLSGKEYNATSNYRLRQYTQIEVPIMLNYALGRMAVYGGPSFSYSFPLQWERSQSFSEKTIETQQLTPTSPFVNSNFMLNEQSDFKARMGLGIVTGITYDFSRTLSIDLRMSKLLWNNGSSQHAAINRLYNNPKIQLSLGYYFGRRDKVVYIMQR